MPTDPAIRDHQAWLGYLQPDGLVVSPAALVDAQVILDTRAIETQQRFMPHVQTIERDDDEVLAVTDLAALCREFLGWPSDCLWGLDAERPLPDDLRVPLPELGETLEPTFAFRDPKPKDAGQPWLLLAQVLTPDAKPAEQLDKDTTGAEANWTASPSRRFERLLRETKVPIGLLTNGTHIRLMYAPRGENSGNVTFPVAAMTEVAGRPILAAFYELLQSYRLLAAPSDARLPALLIRSREYQSSVSTALAQQVLAALYELLRGFQAADERTKGELLRDILAKHPDDVYGGLLTVLLRLVFLLYAEDRGLMPGSSLYVQNYSVHGLFERLRSDYERYPDTMDHRFGAWAQLLALFRAVCHGCANPQMKMPARSGYLFDPRRFPFLEGVTTADKHLPLVPDGVLYRVLSNLLLLDGESELVFALIGAVGTELQKVRSILEDRLKVIGYSVTQVRLTSDVIPAIVNVPTAPGGGEYERLKGLMDAGNAARERSKDNSILALGAAAFINSNRQPDPSAQVQHEPKRRAYIISSLKHPAEVERLREIYPQGFYLIGIHADEKRRYDYLTVDKRIEPERANELIERDEDEQLPHGQKVAETFHLSDFFVRIDGRDEQLKHSLWRVLDLLFGNPYVTPTFDEYAMFLAFAASLSSADLSRQVGAVVALGEQIVATGANDCPRAGGGRYWPRLNEETHRVEDQEDGRDYMRDEDSNKIEQQKIIDEIVTRAERVGLDGQRLRETLDASRIRDLTEFGRVVHAEMEALLSCSRARISTQDGTLYSTTFPCHNCAKHIVAAGITRVVFIEPYQKSKAAEFHTDSIQVGFTDAAAPTDDRPTVRFEPFVGVGPRRFFDLFSIRLGSGYPLKRKDASGRVLEWKPEQGRLRLQMLPASYLDLEFIASNMFNQARAKESGDAG